MARQLLELPRTLRLSVPDLPILNCVLAEWAALIATLEEYTDTILVCFGGV